jgi:ATP synthase protein I
MNEKDRKLIRMVGVLSTVGMVLVFATVIGLYVGLKVDAWLGTSPWFTAIFLFIGIQEPLRVRKPESKKAR